MEINNELETSLMELSYLEKQETNNFINYLKFKKADKYNKDKVGKISFDRFKEIVLESINEKYPQDKIIYELYSSDDAGFYADLLYATVPFDGIVVYQYYYIKEEEKLNLNYSKLWEDMIEAIMKFGSSISNEQLKK